MQTGETTLNQVRAMLAARDLQHQDRLDTAPTRPNGPLPALEEIAFPLPPAAGPGKEISVYSFLQVCSLLGSMAPAPGDWSTVIVSLHAVGDMIAGAAVF